VLHRNLVSTKPNQTTKSISITESFPCLTGFSTTNVLTNQRPLLEEENHHVFTFFSVETWSGNVTFPDTPTKSNSSPNEGRQSTAKCAVGGNVTFPDTPTKSNSSPNEGKNSTAKVTRSFQKNPGLKRRNRHPFPIFPSLAAFLGVLETEGNFMTSAPLQSYF